MKTIQIKRSIGCFFHPSSFLQSFLCMMLCVLLHQAKAQTDTEFWFVAPDVSVGNQAFDTPIVLRITTLSEPSVVTISQPANPSFTPIVTNIAANSTSTVNLTPFLNQIETAPYNTVLNTGLHITSTADVSVYYEVVSGQCNCNPEIFALKGANALGTDFYVPFQNFFSNGSTYNPVPYAAINIVATENNTNVTITPTQALLGHPAGVPFTITLNQGQTWAGRAVTQAAGAHPSGTFVTSDKPIAITMSDDLVYGGSYGTCADLLGDQIVPTWRVGSEYIIMKGSLNGPDKIFVVGTQNGTSLTLGGVSSGTVNAGQTVTFDLTTPSVYLQASAPVYVLHISGFGCELGGAILPPIHCTGSYQLGFTRSTNEQFALNLMTQAGNEGGFLLNGNASLIPASAFSPVPNTNGEWVAAQIYLSTAQVPQGSGNLISNSLGLFRMGIIHGTPSGGTRYGYFSGFNVVETPIIVSSENVCEGQALSLIAETVPGAQVTWTGPNGYTATGTNQVIPQANATHSGTYNAVATMGACGSNPASITVAVNDCSHVINHYTAVTGFDPCTNSILVEAPEYFANATRALIIQMKGAEIDDSDSPAFGDITDWSTAGKYEFVNITGVEGNAITVENTLLNTYDVGGAVQLITVPQYTNLTVTEPIIAQLWNGSTGGVIVMEVIGTLTLQADINADGQGFRGGDISLSHYSGCSSMGYVYDYESGLGGRKGEGIAHYLTGADAGRGKQANGGGGGNHVNAGGGGGSNGGAGGTGGNQWSGCPTIDIGGRGGQTIVYNAADARVFMGGGGGGGHQNDGIEVGTSGAAGGGIIMIKAGSIAVQGGSINSNGAHVSTIAANDGSGGGGAGGSVLIDCPSISGTLPVRVRGGNGGSTNTNNHGTGGGGGGGVVWHSAGLPASSINTDLAGGQAGITSINTNHGATAGEQGVKLGGVVIPQSTTPFTPLVQPTINIVGVTCEGDSLKLEAQAPSAVSYTWTGPGWTATGASVMIPSLATSNTGMYYLTVMDANGCTESDSLSILVHPVTHVNLNVQICEGANYTLPDGTVVAQSGSYPVVLTTMQTQCDSLVTVNLQVTPAQTSHHTVSICQGGNYTLPNGTVVSQSGEYVTVITAPNSGCQIIDTTTVYVYPTYALQEAVSICEGETYTLPNGQSVYQSGHYDMHYTTSLGGCDSTVTYFVTVHPAPVVSFTWTPEEVHAAYTKVQFINESQNATQWLWNFGGLAVSNEREPIFQFPEMMAADYPICLHAHSQHDCMAEYCATVSIRENLIFYCPNAFTPNADGLNERFIPVISGHDPAYYKFEIFNRWGEKVFVTNNPDEGWLGDYYGGDYYVKDEIYFYRVELKEKMTTETRVFQGHITVLR